MLKFKFTFQPELIMLLVRNPEQGAGIERVSNFNTYVATFVTLKENELCDNFTLLCLFIFLHAQRSVLARRASAHIFCQIDHLLGGRHLVE